jgi:hypothetical protein
MVKGLPLFREHFKDFTGQYMLIGGTACTVLLESVGMAFRVTKDLDIVLCAEALTDDFFRAFWAFVQAGGYEIRQKNDGKPQLYRFAKPSDSRYPNMLEIFSRKPDFQLAQGSHLAPIPSDDEAYSLSAILLDDEYYQFIRTGALVLDGITVVEASHLIPLKIRAYLDLYQRKANGEQVDSKSVFKHKNDVLRLMALAPPSPIITLPGDMKQDIDRFIDVLKVERPNPRDLGVTNITLDTMIENLAIMYE